MIALTLEYQSKFDNSNINKHLREPRNNFEKMNQSCLLQKNLNSKLHEQVVALERQYWGNSQYSICKCLEITSVPDIISLECLLLRDEQ